jgi:hypothetical protein
MGKKRSRDLQGELGLKISRVIDARAANVKSTRIFRYDVNTIPVQTRYDTELGRRSLTAGNGRLSYFGTQFGDGANTEDELWRPRLKYRNVSFEGVLGSYEARLMSSLVRFRVFIFLQVRRVYFILHFC